MPSVESVWARPHKQRLLSHALVRRYCGYHQTDRRGHTRAGLLAGAPHVLGDHRLGHRSCVRESLATGPRVALTRHSPTRTSVINPDSACSRMEQFEAVEVRVKHAAVRVFTRRSRTTCSRGRAVSSRAVSPRPSAATGHRARSRAASRSEGLPDHGRSRIDMQLASRATKGKDRTQSHRRPRMIDIEPSGVRWR